MAQAYCVKCKGDRSMKDSELVKMKNGRPAAKGSTIPRPERTPGQALQGIAGFL